MATDPSQETKPDHVGRVMEQWRSSRPDLDIAPMGVIGRLERLWSLVHQQLRPVFAEAGLGDGDFDVLATLRRAEPPHVLTPSQLGSQTLVTSGAITKRVDRLQRLGLVERTVCSDDARSRKIRLTGAGLELADRLIEQHLANEKRLLAGLDADQQAQLVELMISWGRALDPQ